MAALLLALAAAGAGGCGRQPEQAPAPAVPAPLARVGEAAITVEDFEAEVGRRRAGGRLPADAATLLREMIERQAMLQKAGAEMARDPEVKRELENLLLARWLEKSRQAEKAAIVVTDEELRAAYASGRQAWTRAEQARLAILYRRLASGAGAAEAEQLAGALRKAVADFKSAPSAATRGGRMQGFGALAAEASEETVSRYRGGDLGWLDTSRSDYRWPAEVVQAGFALGLGEVSDVIRAGDGLYVVMKSDARAASVTSFEEAAVGLRRRLLREKQEAAEREFKRRLLAEFKVEIDRDSAARLKLPVAEARVVKPPALIPVEERMRK
jgi:parvulin-like peptidyl-prolyl isomerase